MNWKKLCSTGFLLPVFISFLGVTLDLFTTRVAIGLFGASETRPFGNNAIIEYSIFMGLTVLMFFVSEYFGSASTQIYILNKTLMIGIMLLPYFAVLNNILVMGR